MSTSVLQIQRDDIRYLMKLMKQEIKSEINCNAIGTIVSFDAPSNTASVAFNYKKVLRQRNAVNSKEYTDVTIDYPVLVRVPVVIIGGGGGYTTFPIAQGDECLLLFVDRDMDLWLEFGSTTNPPNTTRMHDLSDAVALVGVRSLKTAVTPYSTTSIKTVFGRVVMEFTNLVASIIDRHGERLVPVGTGPIPTFCQTAPSGWLLMYGQTLGKAGSGAIESSDDYEDLFNILKMVSPNSAGASFAAGNIIIIPDCRGRNAVFKNDMGGNESGVLTAAFTPLRSTLGGAIGEEAHKLTIPEMPRHDHDYLTVVAPGAGDSGGALDTYSNQKTGMTGGDQSHNNMPPGIVTNAMIKY